MNRNAIGAAVLGLALAGAGTVLAQPIPEGGRRNGASPPGTASTFRSGPARRTSAWPCFRRPSAVSTVVPLRVRRAPQRSSGTSVRAATSSACFPPARGFRSGTAGSLPTWGSGSASAGRTCERSTEIDRRFNFRIEGGVGVRISAGDGLRLDARGALPAHLQCRDRAFPNLGLNALVLLGRLSLPVRHGGVPRQPEAPPRIRASDGGVDVAARDDADDLAAPARAGQRRGDRSGAGALRDDARPRGEEADGGGDLLEARRREIREQAGRRAATSRAGGSRAADAVDEARACSRSPAWDARRRGRPPAAPRSRPRRRRPCAGSPAPCSADAMPQERPPPPYGTSTVSTSGRSSRISRPIVPLPAITAGSPTGWMKRPSMPGIADARRSTCHQRVERHLARCGAPSRSIAASLVCGAWSGTTTVQGTPERAGVPGDALRHVAGARGPRRRARALVGRRQPHRVRGAADLERPDRLEASRA